MDKKEWLSEFSNNLQYLIQEEGITQKQLAQESGIDQGNLSRYIKGTRMPNVRAVVNIAIALNREVDELINFDDIIHN